MPRLLAVLGDINGLVIRMGCMVKVDYLRSSSDAQNPLPSNFSPKVRTKRLPNTSVVAVPTNTTGRWFHKWSSIETATEQTNSSTLPLTIIAPKTNDNHAL